MSAATLIDTLELLNNCLDDITSPSASKLAVDLEGVNLCRNGTISLLQIMSTISTTVWVIDIFTLGVEAFTHVGPHGHSLKAVLENPRKVKMFWDVRNDSDALFSLYGISLAAVFDVQLLEVAFRRYSSCNSTTVKGLERAVIEYVKPDSSWADVKRAGKALLFPDKGGSYQLFEERPLDPRVLAYAANDVTFLFRLAVVLEERLGPKPCIRWKPRVMKASSARVAESHQPDYNSNGRNRCLSPKF